MSTDLLAKLANDGPLAIIIAVLLGFIFFLIKTILDISEKRYQDEHNRTERMINVLTEFNKTAEMLLKAVK